MEVWAVKQRHPRDKARVSSTMKLVLSTQKKEGVGNVAGAEKIG